MANMVQPQPRFPYYYEAKPGQKFYLEEFITPVHCGIREHAARISGTTLDEVGPGCFKVVAAKEYVLDRDQFGVEEYFQFPWEILKSGKGDCEDQANLLTSLLISCGIQNAMTVYGYVEIDKRRYGHAWTEVGPVFIESTIGEYRPMARPEYYHPEIQIGWLYGMMVSYQPVAWIPGSEEIKKRTLPKLTPEELKELHERLKKPAGEVVAALPSPEGITMWKW